MLAQHEPAEPLLAQHDILIRSLKKVEEEAEGENGGLKIEPILFELNAQDTALCSYFTQRLGQRNKWQNQGYCAIVLS